MKAERLKLPKYRLSWKDSAQKVDDWGKRKLAYEIQKVNEGFYSFTTFEAPAAAPAEIEARMRIMENVLRYLIIRKEA